MKPDFQAIAAEIVALRPNSSSLTGTIGSALAEAYATGIEDGKRDTADLLAACEGALKLWDREESIDHDQGEVDDIRAAISHRQNER